MAQSSSLTFSSVSPSQFLTMDSTDHNFSRFSLHSSNSLQCCNPNFHTRNSSFHPSLSTTISSKTLSDIQISGVIACLCARSSELAWEAACAALNGGVTVVSLSFKQKFDACECIIINEDGFFVIFRGCVCVLEIVMSTPGVLEVLQHLVKEYPGKTIGVGTVLHAKDAKNAVDCGAKFLMSPVIVKDVMDYVSGSNILYIPGVMTPSEILSAYNAGAKIVKVYPVSAIGGTKYIAAVKKPFPHIPMVASQGITLESIQEYIAQGATAVVLSDAIFDKKSMDEKDFKAIYKLANTAARLARESVEMLKF